MKKSWEYKKLGEICRVINGRAYSKDEMLNHGKYRLLRVGNFFTNDSWYYSDLELEEDKYCDKGDLLYAWSASFGPRIWEGEKVIYHYHIWKMVCSAEIDKYFLCYWLDSNELKKQIMTNLHGATMAHITKGIIENAIVSYPPLPEQQRIVSYLDAAFAKIDAMKANAENALKEAKALFQASLKEMMQPKPGWEEKKLGDICIDIRYGTSIPSNENGEYKYLRMNNITNDGFLDVSHYKTISLPEKELEKCLVKRGDIIFNRTNSRELVGKSCVFTEEEKMVIAGYLIRIRLKEGFEPQFITYNMNLQRSLGFLQPLIVGAVHQANISANNIRKVLINYPPLSEQQTIVAALDAIKSRVDRLQSNFDTISRECDALKQAILREVFEGE